MRFGGLPYPREYNTCTLNRSEKSLGSFPSLEIEELTIRKHFSPEIWSLRACHFFTASHRTLASLLPRLISWDVATLTRTPSSQRPSWARRHREIFPALLLPPAVAWSCSFWFVPCPPSTASRARAFAPSPKGARPWSVRVRFRTIGLCDPGPSPDRRVVFQVARAFSFMSTMGISEGRKHRKSFLINFDLIFH